MKFFTCLFLLLSSLTIIFAQDAPPIYTEPSPGELSEESDVCSIPRIGSYEN